MLMPSGGDAHRAREPNRDPRRPRCVTRLSPKPLVLVLGTLAACGWQEACAQCPSLEDYVTTVHDAAGRDARDCGLVRLGMSRTDPVSCSKVALADQRSFSVIFQVMGIDSTIYIGLARRSDGTAERFSWDSDVYGGSRLIARRRISRWPCSDPSIQDADGVDLVSCAD